ncbi:MAG: hypothetical protein C0184_10950 [Chloroflexus aggregans]|uniref:Uncharacterized protein n=2 Tax=Chloroflexus TaxID=1107 RepID=A0A2J6X2U9_9CHLR|nr:MAG: hypothetical protein C0184_10950 [Chloroflexus aggregans]
MTIDSVRLLTDSAAILWRRLSQFGSPDLLARRVSCDEWLATMQPGLSMADEQAIRRDYRRLTRLLAELEMLTRSHEQAIALIMDAIRQSDDTRGEQASLSS